MIPRWDARRVATRNSGERKDLDVVGILVTMNEDFVAAAGLRVDVAGDVTGSSQVQGGTITVKGLD